MDPAKCESPSFPSAFILMVGWYTRLLIGSQGFVTSAQKLNRKGILEKYKKEVDEAYKKASS